MTKRTIALHLGRQECKNYFTTALTVHIYIRVFSISDTIFRRLLKDEANKKTYMQKSTRGKYNRRSARN